MCSSCKKEELPDIGMSDEELIALLQDMHIANTAIRKYKTDHRDSIAQILRAEMAKIHNISEERLEFVVEQIQRSPKRYLKLEKEVVTNLKALKDSLKINPTVNPKVVSTAEKKR